MTDNHVTDAGEMVRPATITAKQFVDDGYVDKVARGECVVRSVDYPQEHIVSIEKVLPNSAGWDILIADNRGIYRSFSTVKFTVEWLSYTEDDWHEVGVRLARDEAAHAEFADGWQAAEIARLQAINAKLYAFVSSFESCDYSEHGDYVKARELEIWHEKAGNLKAEIDDSEPDHK